MSGDGGGGGGGGDKDGDDENTPVIQRGEAMVSLWGAMRSVVAPGTRVLAVCTGLYGHGFAAMARGLGADVRTVESDSWERVVDAGLVEDARKAAEEFRPHVVTAVHCETPSGTLNPLEGIGEVAAAAGALFYVDCVSSAGAAPVDVRACRMDLCLLGSQKALSLPPDHGITVVRERAWARVVEVAYSGYDALLPFRRAHRTGAFPYTMNWRAVRALRYSCELILARGLDRVLAQHAEVAAHCRRRLAEDAGLRLYPEADAGGHSPSVTAARVPDNWTWPALDAALRERGVEFGGNYDRLKDKVFRVGHMGTQASRELVDRAVDTLVDILRKGPPATD